MPKRVTSPTKDGGKPYDAKVSRTVWVAERKSTDHTYSEHLLLQKILLDKFGFECEFHSHGTYYKIYITASGLSPYLNLNNW